MAKMKMDGYDDCIVGVVERAWMGDSTPCFLSKELDKYELLS